MKVSPERLLAALFIAASLALVSIAVHPSMFQYRTVREFKVAHIVYDWHSVEHPVFEHLDSDSGSLLHMDPHTGLPVDLRAHHILINLELLPTSTVGYVDPIGTAPLNQGLRLEYTGHTLALIIGSHDPSGFACYILSNSVVPGHWQTIRVELGLDDHLTAQLNGVEVVNTTIPNTNIAISDLTIGNGHSPERLFKGWIRDASVDYTTVERVPNWLDARVDAETIAAVVAILSLLGFLEQRFRRVRLTEAPRSAPWSILRGNDVSRLNYTRH